MKCIISVLLFCTALTIQAQELNRTITTLSFDEIVAIDTIELQLVKILSDSRCPENVACIRAGEAEVLVDVFKNGKFLKQRKLTFYPSAINKNTTILYTSKTLNISGLNLLPYPKGPGKIKEKNYYLELVVED